MKYPYRLTAILFTAILLMACSDKSASVQKVAEVKEKIVVVESANVTDVKKEVPKNVTQVKEPMVTKNVLADIPTSCAMWSDGCNVCTRTGKGKASCTTNPECTHKMFSCLQWQ